MTIIEGNEYLTVSEAARRAGADRRTVRRWITQGLLPAVDLGEGSRPRRLIPADSLDGFEPPKRNVGRVKAALARSAAADAEYLTVSDLIKQLGVHRNTVYKWLRGGLLPGIIDTEDVHSRWLIPTDALDGFEPPSASGPGRPAGTKMAPGPVSSEEVV